MNNPSTLRQLFEDNKANKIVLPDFQRPLEWRTDKQRRLLASCLVDLSIGSLLFLEGSSNDFPARKIGISKSAHVTPDNECYYLLDGQQRLTSVRSFFTDFFDDKDWKDVFDGIFPQLRCRWFLQLNAENGEDVFGYRKMRFENRMDYIEPEGISHLVISKPLYKTKNTDWWHPDFDTTKFENASANETMIPLYKLSSILQDKNNNIVRRIIKRISERRRADIDTELSELCQNKDLDDVRRFIRSFLGDSVNDRLEAATEACAVQLDFKDDFDNLRADWQADVYKFCESIWDHKINLMILAKEQVGRAIATFTAINEGGQKLSTFDLIVAKAAKNSEVKSLPARISERADENVTIPDSLVSSPPISWNLAQTGAVQDNAIEKWFQDTFINMISGLAWSEYDPTDCTSFIEKLHPNNFKAAKQLSLTCEQINAMTDTALKSLQRAIAFLQFRCGIVSGSDLHYQLMILPIAFSLLHDDVWSSKAKVDKLESWYWTSLFSGAYREGQNERCYSDVKLLVNWLCTNSVAEDTTKELQRRKDQMFQQSNYCDEATFTRDEDADSVPTAMHSACLQYILSTNPPDFLPEDKWEKVKLYPWVIAQSMYSDVPYKAKEKNGDGTTTDKNINLKLSDHHIFPLGSTTKIGESSAKIRREKKHPLNSPMNRTYISTTSNLLISDEMPSVYLPQIMEIAKNFHFVTDHTAADFENADDRFYRKLLKERYDKFTSAVKAEIENLNP